MHFRLSMRIASVLSASFLFPLAAAAMEVVPTVTLAEGKSTIVSGTHGEQLATWKRVHKLTCSATYLHRAQAVHRSARLPKARTR